MMEKSFSSLTLYPLPCCHLAGVCQLSVGSMNCKTNFQITVI